MLGASIGALVLALLPLWLALFGWSEELVYRVSSAFAFLFIGTFVCVMAGAGRRLTLGGYPPRVPLFPATIALLLGVAAAVAGGGAVGWLQQRVAPLYVGVLLSLLVASALVLAVFLILLARLAQSKS